MEISKGLYTDCNEVEQPTGTWRDALNLIYDKSKFRLSNEQGTEEFSRNIPADTTIIGFVEIQDILVVFLKHSTTDQIGYFKTNGMYTTLVSGSTLNFNVNFPVIAKVINDNIIIYTDYYNPIRYINLSNIPSSLTSSKQLDLISPESDNTYFTSTVTAMDSYPAGNFPEGTYYVYMRYRNTDGNVTNYFNSNTGTHITLSAFIAGTSNFFKSQSSIDSGSSNKGIRLIVANTDTDYDYLEVVILGYINGQYVAKKLVDHLVTGASTEYINLTEFEGDIVDIESLFVTKKNLLVHDIEISNDEIFGINIKEDDEINFQKYANMITVTPVLSAVEAYTNVRTFIPGEVYAIYCTLLYNDNRESRAFHIPGTTPTSVDLSASTITGLTDYKKFQVERSNWQNTNETYPNTDDFDDFESGAHTGSNNASTLTDSSKTWTTNQYAGYKIYNITDGSSAVIVSNTSNTITATLSGGTQNDWDTADVYSIGLDLRNDNVKHHKISNFSNLKADAAFSGDDRVGKDQLIKVELKFDNIVIPDKYATKIKGVKFYYVKKNIADRLVLGFSPILYGGKMDDPSDELVDNYVSICSNLIQTISTGVNKKVIPNPDILKFSSLDVMLDKPKLNPVFVQAEIFHTIAVNGSPVDGKVYNVSASGVLLNDTATAGEEKRFTLHSHICSGTSPSPATGFIKAVNKYQYIPENSAFGDVYNRYGEETLLLYGDFDQINSEVTTSSDTLFDGTYVEKSGLLSLRQIPKDVHTPFYKQTEFINIAFEPISGAGSYDVTTVNTGEGYVCLYTTVHTAGSYGDVYPLVDDSAKGYGTMAVRQIAMYSINNPQFRRENPSIDNGQIYLHTEKAVSLLNNYDPTKQVIIDINRSLTNQNQVNNVLPFDPYETFSNYHPYRVIRFTPADREFRNKITFTYLPNSFYELSSEKGIGIAINKINENLILECERGCYITRGKQSLQLKEDTAYIGDNDIFDIVPQPILNTEGRFFGSQSRFTTRVTNLGAIIVDQMDGRIYLFDGQSSPKEISKLGNANLFRLKLPFYEDNYKVTSNYTSLAISGTRGLITLTIGSTQHPSMYNVGDLFLFSASTVVVKILEVKSDSTSIYIYTEEPSGTVSASLCYHYSKLDSPLYNYGVVTGWDKVNNRFLITKKQYGVAEALIPYYRGVYDSTDFWDDLGEGDIYRKNNGFYNIVGGAEETYNIVNKGFTLSFDLDNMIWLSYHSYQPNGYINFNRLFFSIKSDSIHKHYADNIANFYDTQYDSNISVIFNLEQNLTKKFKELYWIALFYDLEDDYIDDKTFDSIDLSTLESQTPNSVSLTPYTNTTNQGNVRSIRDTWHFNTIRDASNNRLFSKYLKVKFNYDNSDNYRFFIQEINAKFNYVKN